MDLSKNRLKKRTPWLLINLITAFMASAVVGLFQGTIEQVVVLAVAMPIITGMGGNSASQTLALVIQEVAIGQLTWEKDKKYVLNEIWLGLVNGIITGIFAANCALHPISKLFLIDYRYFSDGNELNGRGILRFLRTFTFEETKSRPSHFINDFCNNSYRRIRILYFLILS